MTRDRDPMDRTFPPGTTCEVHGETMRQLGEISGLVEGVRDRQDEQGRVMRDGFAEVKDQLRVMAAERASDIRGIALRLDGQDTKIQTLITTTAETKGGIKFAEWLTPILIGVIIAIAGWFIIPQLTN